MSGRRAGRRKAESLESQGAPEGATESHEWVTKEPRRGMESHGDPRKGSTGPRRRTERHEEPRRSMQSHTAPQGSQREPQGDMESDGESKRGTDRPQSHGEAREGH